MIKIGDFSKLSRIRAFFLTRDSLHFSVQKSVAVKVPAASRSLPISEVSITTNWLSKSTLVACPSRLAEPVTKFVFLADFSQAPGP